MARPALSDGTGLADRIYEAAVSPQLWPALMQSIADRAGARGAVFIARSEDDVRWTVSPRIEQIVHDYMAEGWATEGSHTAPLFAELHPGFRTETHYRTEAEVAAMPVHREFLNPRGMIAGSATVLQGVEHAAMHFAVEGFATHSAAHRALGFLDALRPDLGRALSLSAKLRQSRSELVIETLATVGVAAAVVAPGGHLRTFNEGFATRLGDYIVDLRGRLRFLDRSADDQLAAALAGSRIGMVGARSIAVRDAHGVAPFALHVFPVPHRARDLFESDGLLLVLADGLNRSLPGADLLRVLFDLTPAEARLARLLLEGKSLAEAAAACGVKEGTARVQLRGVFAKTGTRRQAELVLMLSGFAPGGA